MYYSVPPEKTLLLSGAAFPGNEYRIFIDFPADGEGPLGWWEDNLNALPLNPEQPMICPSGTQFILRNISSNVTLQPGRLGFGWLYGFLIEQ